MVRTCCRITSSERESHSVFAATSQVALKAWCRAEAQTNAHSAARTDREATKTDRSRRRSTTRYAIVVVDVDWVGALRSGSVAGPGKGDLSAQRRCVKIQGRRRSLRGTGRASSPLQSTAPPRQRRVESHSVAVVETALRFRETGARRETEHHGGSRRTRRLHDGGLSQRQAPGWRATAGAGESR